MCSEQSCSYKVKTSLKDVHNKHLLRMNNKWTMKWEPQLTGISGWMRTLDICHNNELHNIFFMFGKSAFDCSLILFASSFDLNCIGNWGKESNEIELSCFSFSLTQSAHMPMIDALMMAYTVEMISIEKVVASVKRFSTFSASKELPFDLEDAMVFWINKVWTHRHKQWMKCYVMVPYIQSPAGHDDPRLLHVDIVARAMTQCVH